MPSGVNFERTRADGSPEFDICIEFDCCPEYHKKQTGRNCKGEYWNSACGFHGEHQVLNEDKEREDIA